MSYTTRVDWDVDGTFSDAIDDVSSYVQNETWTRGRNADFSGDATGSATIVLLNTDGRFSPDRNWFDNPSFESDTSGWSVNALSGITAAGTSITQVTDNAPNAGTKAAEIVLPSVSGAGAYYSLPYTFRAGIPYSGTIYVKSMSGSLGLRVGIASAGTTADIATTSSNVTTAWVSYPWTWTPAADYSDVAVFLRATGASGATVRIDAVQLNPGASANPYLEAPTKGQLCPGRPVHIYEGTNDPQFFGYIETLTPDVAGQTVTITCYDVFQRLSEVDVVVPASTLAQVSSRDLRLAVLEEFERGSLNLLANPSFESPFNIDGWEESGGSFQAFADTAPGVDGSQCAKWTCTADSQNVRGHAYLSPAIIKDQVYRGTIWLRLESGASTWNISLATAVTIGTRQILLTTTWQQFTVTGIADATYRICDQPLDIVITPTSGVTGVIHFDAVQISRGIAQYPYSDTGTGRYSNYVNGGSFDSDATNGIIEPWTNLCGNGGFETNATGWVNVTQTTAQHYSGTHSGAIGASTTATYALTGTFLSTKVYRLTIAALSSKATPVMTVGLRSSGTTGDNAKVTVGPSGSSIWNFMTVDWQPSSNRTDAQIYVVTSSGETGNIDIAQVWRRDQNAGATPDYSDVGPLGQSGTFYSDQRVVMTQAMWGNSSLQVTTSATAGAGIVYDLNQTGCYFVDSFEYVMSAWVFCTGTMPYLAGVGANENASEDNGSVGWDAATVTGTIPANTWTQVSTTWTPSSDRSSADPLKCVFGLWQTDATARVFFVDGIRITPGSVADDFEMDQWSLSTNSNEFYLSTVNLAGTALQSLDTINAIDLTEHWIEPTMTAPYYQYVTQSRADRNSLTVSEVFDNDFIGFDSVETDRTSIINVVPITTALGGTFYYSDPTSVGKYGPRPVSAIDASAFLDGTLVDSTTVDAIGGTYLTRFKDGKSRPILTAINRFPLRELGQRITVNLDSVPALYKLFLHGGSFLIISLTVTVSEAGLWTTVAYQLESY